MTKKIGLLALVAINAAMFVGTATASAGEWKLDPAGGKFPQLFSLNDFTTTLTVDGSSLKVTCTTTTGSGSYESATTSRVELTYNKCTENLFGSSCTSSGSSSGTIKPTKLTGHNVILEASPSVRGILLTPSSGHFASFTCGGGLVTGVVNGNGIIAELTSPVFCNTTQGSATLKFESLFTGTQRWTQVTTSGTSFDLTSSQNGGTAATASLDGQLAVSFFENQTFTC